LGRGPSVMARRECGRIREALARDEVVRHRDGSFPSPVSRCLVSDRDSSAFVRLQCASNSRQGTLDFHVTRRFAILASCRRLSPMVRRRPPAAAPPVPTPTHWIRWETDRLSWWCVISSPGAGPTVSDRILGKAFPPISLRSGCVASRPPDSWSGGHTGTGPAPCLSSGRKGTCVRSGAASHGRLKGTRRPGHGGEDRPPVERFEPKCAWTIGASGGEYSGRAMSGDLYV
jgi:hypothetical protein